MHDIKGYFLVFVETYLVIPYAAVSLLVVGWALADNGRMSTRRRSAITYFAWVTLVAALLNLLFATIEFRIVAFLVISLGGFAAIRIIEWPYRDN